MVSQKGLLLPQRGVNGTTERAPVTCGTVDEEGEVSLLLVLDNELLQPLRDHSAPAPPPHHHHQRLDQQQHAVAGQCAIISNCS